MLHLAFHFEPMMFNQFFRPFEKETSSYKTTNFLPFHYLTSRPALKLPIPSTQPCKALKPTINTSVLSPHFQLAPVHAGLTKRKALSVIDSNVAAKKERRGEIF